jgi:hypothetical protein
LDIQNCFPGDYVKANHWKGDISGSADGGNTLPTNSLFF